MHVIYLFILITYNRGDEERRVSVRSPLGFSFDIALANVNEQYSLVWVPGRDPYGRWFNIRD